MVTLGKGPPLYPESFWVSLNNGAAYDRKVLYVCPEEVTEPHE